jgi:putative drug exporter of the RND superfamily
MTAPHAPGMRLRLLLPAVLILIWLAAAAMGGPIFGRISEVSSNDQASFLPASAESTEAGEWQRKFTESDIIPAIVIFESDIPLNGQDLAGYAAIGDRMAEIGGVQPAAGPQAPSVIGPIPSEDGLAVQFIVPISEEAELKETVAQLRETVAQELPAGTRGYVTGPAGLTADLVSAFGGVDGLLLVVALGAVFVILLAVYRSVILPFLVLLTSVFALCAAILTIYLMASAGWIQLNGQSQGILSILVIGAATDYALLLVARYRDALTKSASTWTALRTAVRGSVEPIVASAATVVLALLCLLISDLQSNRSLGPIAAVGIIFSLLAALSFLPALLAVFGRRAFWPFTPRPAPSGAERAEANEARTATRGLWSGVARLVAARPRSTWITSTVLLVLLCGGLFQLQAHGVAQTDLVLSESDAADGQQAQARHFDAGSGSPVTIIAAESNAGAVLELVRGTEGIAQASVLAGSGGAEAGGAAAAASPLVREGRVLINATLAYEADSEEAEDTVRELRRALPAADPGAMVGGVTATAVDTNDTAQADFAKILPIVLLVITLILMVLLRSVVAPLLLVGSVALSYAATLGVSALMFNHVLGFPGADASVPLFGFVFLVALGVDYNIFLMTRVREESLRSGTREGVLRGLRVTGGVITSAGIVLAATFAALGVIPILFLAQIAFIVAFGVLLDTLLVRSLLVPALAYDIGPAIWWPSRLARDPEGPTPDTAQDPAAAGPAPGSGPPVRARAR